MDTRESETFKRTRVEDPVQAMAQLMQYMSSLIKPELVASQAPPVDHLDPSKPGPLPAWASQLTDCRGLTPWNNS
jgi:hypothetical protein